MNIFSQISLFNMKFQNKLMSLKGDWLALKWKFMHWLIRWNAEPAEEGGSVVLSFCGVLHLLKYKQSTIFYFGKHPEFKEARKHVEAYDERG